MEEINLICLNDDLIIFDYNDYKNNFDIVESDFDTKFDSQNPALKIDFKNDLKYSIKCIKKLISLKKSNINFYTKFNGYKVKYVISNYNDSILDALKAIEISNLKEKYTFIYDSVFKNWMIFGVKRIIVIFAITNVLLPKCIKILISWMVVAILLE